MRRHVRPRRFKRYNEPIIVSVRILKECGYLAYDFLGFEGNLGDAVEFCSQAPFYKPRAKSLLVRGCYRRAAPFTPSDEQPPDAGVFFEAPLNFHPPGGDGKRTILHGVWLRVHASP